MSADQVRETLESYLRSLLERSDYGRFFADDIEVSLVGTDQKAVGPEAAEQMIRFFHEVAFDAQPELVNELTGERGAAVEAVFVGTHTGEFAGVPASGNAVRVPYPVTLVLGGAVIGGVLRRARRQDHGAADLHVARRIGAPDQRARGGFRAGVIRFTPTGDREDDPDATKYVTQRLTTSKTSKAPG